MRVNLKKYKGQPEEFADIPLNISVRPDRPNDVFISYASEDREKVAGPLAKALKERNLKVWYDEFVLQVGDSLKSRIDAGIAASKFAVIILSDVFLGKSWPKYELKTILSLKDHEKQQILPIWHNVTEKEIEKALEKDSSILLGIVALKTESKTIDQIAAAIAKSIHSQSG